MVTIDTVDDAQKNFEKYITQLDDANKQRDLDLSDLAQKIAEMVEACKTNPEKAMQMAQLCILPGAMTAQEDSMGQLASSMNVSSALLKFTTVAKEAMNTADKGGMTAETAAHFVAYIKQAYTDVKAELNLKAPHLAPETAANILDALDRVAATFGATSPDDPAFNAATVQTDLNRWMTNPTGPTDAAHEGSATGQQNVQNLQASFTQWSNTETAQSQSLQAEEQFATNECAQWMGALTKMFQSQQQSNEAMVRGQKG